MVVSELRGEKIDIIPYNDEPARFVAKALSPARVREVLVDDDGKQATVIVPDDQLSLAIGREGQNARLAARLTGWRIDIRSETEFADRGAGGRLRGGGRRAGAAPRSSPRAGAARTPRCRARATAACRRTRRSRAPAATTSAASPSRRRSRWTPRRRPPRSRWPPTTRPSAPSRSRRPSGRRGRARARRGGIRLIATDPQRRCVGCGQTRLEGRPASASRSRGDEVVVDRAATPPRARRIRLTDGPVRRRAVTRRRSAGPSGAPWRSPTQLRRIME